METLRSSPFFFFSKKTDPLQFVPSQIWFIYFKTIVIGIPILFRKLRRSQPVFNGLMFPIDLQCKTFMYRQPKWIKPLQQLLGMTIDMCH